MRVKPIVQKSNPLNDLVRLKSKVMKPLPWADSGCLVERAALGRQQHLQQPLYGWPEQVSEHWWFPATLLIVPVTHWNILWDPNQLQLRMKRTSGEWNSTLRVLWNKYYLVSVMR
jgi:hypothetical protein